MKTAWVCAASVGFLLLSGMAAIAAEWAEVEVPAGQSPQTAIEEVARLRQAGHVGRVRVTFAAGDYRLRDTIRLSKQDGDGVVWCAAPGGRVRFLGGVRVPVAQFAEVTDSAVLSRLPPERTAKAFVADVSRQLPWPVRAHGDVTRGVPVAPHLQVNGRTLHYARWPNEGWTGFSRVLETGTAPRFATEPEQKKWKPKPGVFVYENPRAARWDFSRGVLLNGYWTHDWDNETRRAIAYERKGTNQTIRFAAPGTYGTGVGTWGLKERRFRAVDLLEELDAPGEWHLDRERKRLYVVPPEGAFAETDEVALAMFEKPLLECRASGFRFEGIEFAQGARDGVVVKADDVSFVGCRFLGLGARALAISGSRNLVRSCEFAQIGAACVVIDGGDRQRLVRAESAVEDCRMHEYGLFKRVYAGACNVGGCGITIRGNRMYDAPHLAILYGGNEILIESNEIHHVCLETNDAGAIYTGRDWTTMGNVLRHNFIHHLGRPDSAGKNAVMGIYFDDCDFGDEVDGNVLWKIPRGIMVGGGREHPIRNNLFVDCDLAYSIDNRGMTNPNWNLPGTSWHLEGYAEALHYREEPWRSRYPLLANILSDDPKEPKYDPVENNVFVDCREINHLPKGEKGEKALSNLVMRANLVVYTRGTDDRVIPLDGRPAVRAGFRVLSGTPERPIDLGFLDRDNGDFRLKEKARLRQEAPGFRPPGLLRPPAATGEAVVDIDCGRQLFVDDFLIESSQGVVRHWNRPVKAEDPVIWPGGGAGAAARPKGERPANLTCSSDGGLWWDPTLGKFRLWYQADWCGDICYAESADGIRWTYPDLGKVPGTNRVFVDDDIDSWCVMPDYTAQNPHSRWLMQISAPHNGSEDSLWTSSDGRTFSKIWTAGVSGDRTTCYYDPFRGEWIFSLRDYRPKTVGRCRLQFASKRFGGDGCSWHWRGIGKEKEKPGREQFPVPCELLAYAKGSDRELYSFNAVAYESVMLGVMEVLYRTPGDNLDGYRTGLPKQTHLHYCFSRDGRTYVPREEADLSPAGHGTGKWDTGYLACLSGVCVIRDERLCFYYSGLRGNGLVTSEKEEGEWWKNGMYSNGSIGYATLRRDGFAGMVSDASGEIVTRPLRFSGMHLFVNADCRFGEVAAEVLDESGKAIPGFTADRCLPFSGVDSTKAEIRWKDAALSKLAGRTVRFRFKLRLATLFAFWVSPSARGESRGYVAGGGPAYPGLRDL